MSETPKKGPPPLPWKGKKTSVAQPAAIQETVSAVQKVLTPAVETTVEKVEDIPMTFAEAAALLKNEGYDLEKERADVVALHDKCGIVRALKEKGVVQTADQYGALFDATQLSAKGVRDLVARLRCFHQQIKEFSQNDPRPYQEQFEALNYNLLPVFNSGHLSFRELWQRLESSGIPTAFDDSDIFDFRKVDPGDIDLTRLSGLQQNVRDDEDKRDILKAAYLKAPELQQNSPQVLFTSTLVEEKLKAVEYMKEAARVTAVPLIDPASDLIRLMTQYARRDELLNKPSALEAYSLERMYLDCGIILYYPLHVLPSGRFFSLRNSTDGVGYFLHLIGEDPGYEEYGCGTRRVLYG